MAGPGGTVVFGTERIPAYKVSVQLRPQQAPPVRTNPETTRADRQGTRAIKIITLDGGLGVRRGSENSDDIQRIKSSQGNWSHIFGSLTLPPAMTQQTALAAVDISGYRAVNRHVHCLNSTLGGSKNQLYAFLGTKMYRPTSTSNPALADSTLALTDNITGAFEGMLNSTRYIILGTGGTTNDVQAVSDPTATPPTRTTAFALSAGDWVGGGFYLPNLGRGFDVFYGKIGGVPGFHFLKTDEALLTAPKPVVIAATKDILGDLTSVSTGNRSPARAHGVSGVQPSGATWINPAAVLVSNNSRATMSPSSDGFGGWDAYLETSDFDFSDVPLSAYVTELTFGMENQESNADDNIFEEEKRFTVAGQAVGLNFADEDEWGTTETPGDSVTGVFGLDLRGTDLRTIGQRLKVAHIGGVTATAQIDHMFIALSYKMPGTIASIPLGGKVIGIHPQEANVGYILAPEFQDDTISVNVPRILWRLSFAYDVAGDRPVVTIEKVKTEMPHVEAAYFAMGGLVLAGGDNSGGAKICRRLDPTGEVFDLNFSGGQGFTEAWGIYSIHNAAGQVVADCALDDATVAQAMVCVDGKWSAIGPRETITALPLAIVGDSIDLNQRYRYRFRPNSTSTAASRQYQPADLMKDPLIHLTGITKQDGVLTTDLPALDLFGPEEALKALINAWCLSRDVSSTNTIRVRYSTDDGSTKTTWATFTAYGSKATLSPPILERTTLIEIGLNHTSSSAGTPNGIPLLFEGLSQWPVLRVWRVYVNPDDPVFREKYPVGGIEKLWDNLATLQASNPVQTFKPGNGVSELAMWDGYRSVYQPERDPTMRGNPITEPDDFPQTGHWFEFAEVIS